VARSSPIKCEVLDEDGRRRLLGYARLRNEHAGADPQSPANCAVENAGQPFSAGQHRVASSSDESGGSVRTALAALPRVPQRPGSHHDGIGIRMASDTTQPRAFSLRRSLVRDGGSRCEIRRQRRNKPRPARGIRTGCLSHSPLRRNPFSMIARNGRRRDRARPDANTPPSAAHSTRLERRQYAQNMHSHCRINAHFPQRNNDISLD